MKRRLVIETDGAGVQVIECAWTPLECHAVFGMMLEAIEQGKFPLPQGMPQFVEPVAPPVPPREE